MKFAILISAAPLTHQAADTAVQFASAALAARHSIHRVFFYHDAVHSGTRLGCAPADERDLTARWQQLHDEHGTDLVICIAAAQRRGVVDETLAREHGLAADNLARGFRIGGLGLLAEACLEADRLVQFGA